MTEQARFCPRCGDALRDAVAGDRPRPTCACGFVDWGNPAPATAVAVLRGDELLWVRRARAPFAGAWSLPSGFLESDEDVRDCALREAREETGLELRLGELFDAISCFDDPRGVSLLVVYLATVAGGEERAGDDADRLGWYPLDAPPEPVAWASHRQVLARLLDRRDAAEPAD